MHRASRKYERAVPVPSLRPHALQSPNLAVLAMVRAVDLLDTLAPQNLGSLHDEQVRALHPRSRSPVRLGHLATCFTAILSHESHGFSKGSNQASGSPLPIDVPTDP